MSNNQTRKIVRVRSLFAAALVVGCALSTASSAAAQTIASPKTPDSITPPTGNTAFLVGHAYGTQGYTCLPTSTGGTAWSAGARPEATLFADVFGKPVQFNTHFTSIDASPNDFAPKPVPLSGSATWQGSLDTSRVWAQKTGSIDGGSDAVSCPNKGAIPCLLLHSIGNQEGLAGGKLLAKVTYVQRLNTSGGAAPATACSVGETRLQPYTADYYFFHGNE